jgi:FAD/FMN-containing dehydrogenase
VTAGESAWTQHAAAVDRLRASYGAIPAGQPVRLAKKTSNLFRPRQATHAPGLDVSGLDGVIFVDPKARTADVGGMTTYEHLVDATLPYGLMPFVVPQLRTITLGGAVSGLGIESTSFRSGLPHESVVEMDVFTGAGEVVTTRPGDDLFDAFPNSYGSLGYATRLRIELEPIRSHVALRHVRFDDPGLMAKSIAMIVESGEYAGEHVDGLDGVAFEPGEYYLTLARWSDHPGGGARASDYAGQEIYYRSIQQRETDLLTMYDYLWRWDTDWFWCSRAFGAQDPRIRRFWPRRYRRSAFYWKLIGYDQRFNIADRIEKRNGRPPLERVVQDIEVPIGRAAEFVDWFLANVPIEPIWLCPLRLRDDTNWPLYPIRAHHTYVNIGFWSSVPVGAGEGEGHTNKLIERKVSDLEGHKSLYSDAYYSPDEFDELYGGETYKTVKKSYDPDSRLLDLYAKAVQRR